MGPYELRDQQRRVGEHAFVWHPLYLLQASTCQIFRASLSIVELTTTCHFRHQKQAVMLNA
jgi:hypothetical protein